MENLILVTGSTGHVGSAVVKALRQRGLAARAAVRAPDTKHDVDSETVQLDFCDRSTWAAAVTGARHVFLMRPPAIADVQNNLNPFIDLARSRGVDHIVFLSVAGAEKNRFVPHRKVEDHLRSRGEAFTNLRPGFFAQNLQSAYRRDIVDDDRIYVPAGHRPVNWIDARDIAEVAAVILEDPRSHRARDYTLAGPGPVRWSEVVEALSRSLGREVRYEAASVWGYVRHLKRRGAPRGAIAAQTLLHFLLRFGQGALEDPTLERLLGRPGRSIHEYIEDHADLWVKPAT